MDLMLVFVHVAANVVWIGAILAVGVALGSSAAEAPVRGSLALEIYRKLAVPGFVLAFVAGLTRLVQNLDYFFVQTRFMHAKLPLVIAVIALHHVLGARARKMAAGEAAASGSVTRLSGALLVCAVGAAYLAVFKPF